MPTNPIGPAVQITWGDSIEFVPIHPAYEIPSNFYTLENWRPSDDWIEYNPTFKASKKLGKLKYSVTYTLEDHPQLRNRNIDWGTSEITIDKESQKVSVIWRSPDSEDDGKHFPAKLVNRRARSRTNARPTIRNQSQLRKLLLSTDRVCAITGECTQTVLECAHILAVENGGFESFDNLILLRADLHCLYDGGCFEISPNGKIVKLSREVSDHYRKLLIGKRLNEKVTRRVSASLAKRWQA